MGQRLQDQRDQHGADEPTCHTGDEKERTRRDCQYVLCQRSYVFYLLMYYLLHGTLTCSAVLGGNPSLLYPTTKGAIIQMTRAMAAQHGPENIRVNCVCPGMVFTPMVRGRGMTDEMRQARINQNLLRQEGTGWDVGYGKFRDKRTRVA